MASLKAAQRLNVGDRVGDVLFRLGFVEHHAVNALQLDRDWPAEAMLLEDLQQAGEIDGPFPSAGKFQVMYWPLWSLTSTVAT